MFDLANMNKLGQARKKWESGLIPLSLIKSDFTVLVILSDPNKNRTNHYSCHRYFKVGDEWGISVDGRDVPLVAVFSWLNDPSARSTTEDGYVSPNCG